METITTVRWCALMLVTVAGAVHAQEAVITQAGVLPFGQDRPRSSPMDHNDVYPVEVPAGLDASSSFSVERVRQLSEVSNVRELLMNFLQDPSICSSPTFMEIIVGNNKEDMRGRLWWSKRCAGQRGSKPNLDPVSQPASEITKKQENAINKLLKNKKIKCNPKKTVVPLPITDPHITLYPSCVYIKQCSGCCDTDQLECVPVRNKTKKFTVMAIQGLHSTRARLSSRAVQTVRVQEHRSCQCQCKTRAEHCSPQQTYNADACQCVCPYTRSRSCPSGKIWSEQECDCVCRRVSDCTTGRHFDLNSCRCLRN